LIGGYNLYNILAAVSAGIAMDLPLETIQEGVEAVEGVSGRFETVGNRKEIHVVVDYAHTRDALERVLVGLRQILMSPSPGGDSSADLPSRRKIITVFGCGGDRDRTKRPLMGEVAAKYSDLCILTSDNPRTEDPLAIMREVERGFETAALRKWREDEIDSWRSGKGYLAIADRREAIRRAIRLARPFDIVLIAGKGHEDYQVIGKEKFPFDDRVEARKALEEK
jgi:UDP-N-acetylmuramoyl-L-alanyl-D-glutamate--2,6-diaminopimelate ligase